VQAPVSVAPLPPVPVVPVGPPVAKIEGATLETVSVRGVLESLTLDVEASSDNFLFLFF
jgi:hypothetical protein